MPYQSPEQYVKDFVESVLNEVFPDKNYILKEVKVLGLQYRADFGIGSIVIEAEAPGNRKRGVDQLKTYLKNKRFNFRVGILIDIPTERYYMEYPNPYNGEVGFEVYVRTPTDDIQQVYSVLYNVTVTNTSELEKAKEGLKSWLEALRRLEIAKLEPSVDHILHSVQKLVEQYRGVLVELLNNARGRISMYERVWRRNMELIYGGDVANKIGDLRGLFATLTIYVTFLKVLGSTLLEAILGGGRYTIPFLLASQGSNSAVKLFWEKQALVRFNINYLFERDEYDWIFEPDIASKLDKFFRDLGKELLSFDWSRRIELDLLKRVYQNIVPVEVRRRLGEFYTPDWIAKLILYRALHILVRNKPPQELMPENIDDKIEELIDEYYKRYGRIPSFIDPTCGSFTFGIHYINLLIDWYYRYKPNIHPSDMAVQILDNVIGLDLNPVAVITAKVNYLLQIYSLIARPRERETYLVAQPVIPIIRTDTTILHDISMSRRSVTLESFIAILDDIITIRVPVDLFGDVNEVSESLTKCGFKLEKKSRRIDNEKVTLEFIELKVPRRLLDVENITITKLYRGLVALLDNGVTGLENELGFSLSVNEKDLLNKLVNSIKCLEEKGLDIYWHSMLLNTLLAAYASRRDFDMVIGNLPWVNISSFPKIYRERLKSIMDDLKVRPPREAARKADISIPLFAISARYLLNRGGIIALMVPTSIFKGLHGASWRNFDAMELKLFEIWDLEDIKPFEGADNQPGIVFALK